ncbi:MAG: acetylglutamate kinase [Planctomycetota bacterium]|nr:acetylglutamate kinase [Planctomycetota bacterium]
MKDVHLLREALPYLRRHRRRTMVIKIGGEIASSEEALDSLAQDISLLTHVNIRIVLVHGGGPQATTLSQKLGLQPRMVQGRRVTDEDTLAVAKMVFAGQINVDILSRLRRHGVRAVGLSGVDGDILQATRRPPTEMTDAKTGEVELVDFGHVGDVTAADTSLLSLLVENGYVPVVSSLAADDEGNALNVNADTVASVLARDLNASKLVMLTNVVGVLTDPKDPSTLVSRATVSEARAMIANGTVSGGMVPKLMMLIEALEDGVGEVVILSGVEKSALLLELFTDRGVGTLITQDGSA